MSETSHSYERCAMATELKINGKQHQVDLPDDVPLLWVLRDEIGLTGTKFGCGVAACGACTVHIDGEAVRSCQVALSDVWGDVTTIEGSAHPMRWLQSSRPGSIIRLRNAATVNPARSCKPPRCWQKTRRPRIQILTMQCRAICAAVAPTPASALRSTTLHPS